MRAEVRKEKWSPARDFLPLILGKNLSAELDDQDEKKLALFETGLAKELVKGDTIAQAISKIVRMALAAEFGASIVAAAGAKKMIATITQAILREPQLKKQALIIVDRFANE